MRSFWLFSFVSYISQFGQHRKAERYLKRCDRIHIYLPSNPDRPLEMQAFSAIMQQLLKPGAELPLSGYSAPTLAGAFRTSVEDEMESDWITCLTVLDWKPEAMSDASFYERLTRLRYYIEGAYAGAGCPQEKILIEIERDVAQLR